MSVKLQSCKRLLLKLVWREAAKLELEKIPAKDKALRLQILTRQSVQESAKLAFVLAEQEKKANDELKKSMEAVSKQVAEFKDRAAFEREYGELITQGTCLPRQSNI
jgi:hypothetical protein